MADLLKDNPVSNFSRGFFYPFRGFRTLLAHPRLLKYIVIPFLINAIVFSTTVYLGLELFQDLLAGYLPQGEAWYWALAYYFAWVVALVLTAVLVFFTFTVVGNLIASPFNDLLSERTEQILTGVRREEPFSLKLFWKDSLRILREEAKRLGLFVAGMLFLLLLNLIPGLGQLLYSVAAVLFTLFFLVVEYLAFVLARKRFSFKEQRRYILSRKFLMLGFGTGVFCVLLIPFFQFFCIPLAVVGATALWVDSSGPSPDSLPGGQGKG